MGKLVNYHIYGGHNVIATGEHVNQQVRIVHQGDAASLLDYLREQGVEEEDLQELGNAAFFVSDPALSVPEQVAQAQGFGQAVQGRQVLRAGTRPSLLPAPHALPVGTHLPGGLRPGQSRLRLQPLRESARKTRLTLLYGMRFLSIGGVLYRNSSRTLPSRVRYVSSLALLWVGAAVPPVTC